MTKAEKRQKVENIRRRARLKKQEGQKKILAIDPAENTGWAIANDVYGQWNFKLKRDENFGMKILRFKSKLKEVFELEKPDIIAFERPAGRNGAALISHSKFVGIIELFCTENDIPYKGYSASEIKKFGTGKGNAGKPLMVQHAKEKYGYQGDSHDEADALHLMNYCKHDLNL